MIVWQRQPMCLPACPLPGELAVFGLARPRIRGIRCIQSAQCRVKSAWQFILPKRSSPVTASKWPR